MTVTSYEDYKVYLKDLIKETAERGYVTKLANAAGCQKSYLTQVLHAHVHLTPEHALALTEFWQMNEIEQDYFLQLVHLGRAGTQGLKQKIKKQLKKLRDEDRDLSRRYPQEMVENPEYQAFYYGTWQPMAVHMACSLPNLKTATEISKYLSVPLDRVQKILSHLERSGLVKKINQEWRQGKNSIHLPERSQFTALNHYNWRTQAVLDSQTRLQSSLHYTAVFSLSRKDLEMMRAQLMSLIDEQRKRIAESKEELVATMTCDLFEVGREL